MFSINASLGSLRPAVEKILSMFTWLKGKKTYICGAAIAIVAFLRFTGNIDPQLADDLISLFAGGGLLALRAAIHDAHNAQLDALDSAAEGILAQLAGQDAAQGQKTASAAAPAAGS